MIYLQKRPVRKKPNCSYNVLPFSVSTLKWEHRKSSEVNLRTICAIPELTRSFRLVSNKIQTARHKLSTACPSPLNIRVVFFRWYQLSITKWKILPKAFFFLNLYFTWTNFQVGLTFFGPPNINPDGVPLHDIL